MAQNGGGASPSVPIAIPQERGSGAAPSTSAPLTSPDLARNLSFLSGPHVITVQSFKARPSPDKRRIAEDEPARREAGWGLASPGVAGAAIGLPGGLQDLEAPLLPPRPSTAEDAARRKLRRQITFAQGLSWVVNIALLVAKLYAWLLSGSKAVMASAADSAVDLVSQVVISYTDWQMNRADPQFPVGQARLEALGVLACACVMAVASFEVVAESVDALYRGIWQGELPDLELGPVMYAVLGSATVAKLVCFVVCNALKARSDSMLALAEDHLNDIMSNLAAVGAAAATTLVDGGWWIDPASAMLISVWICWRWGTIARTQVHKLVGRGAPAEFIDQLKALADQHHRDLEVDVIRAYHFGTRYLVEMEVVLPGDWTLQQSHDVALMLQHKVEALEDVERAFVHTDYQTRDYPEHKVERALGLHSSGSGNAPLLAGAGSGSFGRVPTGSGGGAGGDAGSGGARSTPGRNDPAAALE